MVGSIVGPHLLNLLFSVCFCSLTKSNNQWEFEEKMYEMTPCQIFTFDCTGDITRFQPPPLLADRLHFYHWCLGTEYKPAPPKGKSAIQGEMLTLDMIQKRLNHTNIDLFKIDIEGKELC